MFSSRFIGPLCLGLVLLTACQSSAGKSSTPVKRSGIDHIVVIMEENKNYSDILGNPNMPFLNNLAKTYAVASNYYATVHPSIGNYFFLTMGSIPSTDDAYQGTITTDNLVRELALAKKSWKSYAESIPSARYIGDNAGLYAKRHNPFAYFSDVRNSATVAGNIVPFEQFAIDVANNKLPAFSFIAPNMLDDGHNCPPQSINCTKDELTLTDAWLSKNFSSLLASKSFRNGLLVVSYDEAGTDNVHGGGRIATVLAGSMVRRGYVSKTFLEHDSLLKLFIEHLGLKNYLGSSAQAPSMEEFLTKSR